MAQNLKDKISNEQVYDMYINRKMSSTEIARHFGCTHRTILLRLKKMGVNRRDNSSSVFLSNGREAPKELDDYSYMYREYVQKRRTRDSIGADLNVPPSCVARHLKKLGIHIRDNSESKIGTRNGSYHPNWQGGITPLSLLCREYFYTNLAPQARVRDHFKCQLCGAKQHLDVHHKKSFSSILKEIREEHPDLDLITDVEKLYRIVTTDDRFLDLDNLITYCRDCHFYKVHGYKKSISNEAC